MEGPPGLARYETLVNAEEQEMTTIGDAPLEDVPDETEVTTFGEQEYEPDRPDVITFEEQDTRSLSRPKDEDPRSLLRPVPPNETRDELNLRETAGAPSKHGSDSRTCQGVFHNADVNTNVVGLITDCIGYFDAIAGVHGSAAMCREELLYNADVNTNVVGLITDCIGDFDAIAGVHGSAAMCREELLYNGDVNSTVAGLVTDCTGDFGTTAGVPDSAAMGGVCN